MIHLRSILVALAIVLACPQAWAALSASTVWEVRTTGNDTNGGGFVTGASGTDWSQQDAAQYSVTDGVTAGTTTITSATANFGTDVVGNIMYVEGGTGTVAAGWYEITARTNATTITVDRSTGLTAGTGVTLKIGGALATLAVAKDSMVAGNVIYMKAGTYSSGAVDFTTIGGTGRTAPLTVVGYGSSRSDFTGWPTINASSGSITVIRWGQFGTIRNILVDGDGNGSVVGFNVDYGASATHGIDLRAQNCATGITTNASIDNCYANNCTTGISAVAAGVVVAGCVVVGGVDAFGGGSDASFVNCIASGASGVGFSPGRFRNCTAYGCQDGFWLWTGASSAVNCVAYGNSRYGFREVFPSTVLRNCAYGSNTSGNVNGTTGVPAIVDGNITLSADPFNNAAGGDFSLNNTAGGGADLRAAGIPGVFPGGLTTSYPDIGAAQHEDAGGSPVQSFIFGQ